MYYYKKIRKLQKYKFLFRNLKDNISSNVDRTHNTVESGNVELVKANRYAVN